VTRRAAHVAELGARRGHAAVRRPAVDRGATRTADSSTPGRGRAAGASAPGRGRAADDAGARGGPRRRRRRRGRSGGRRAPAPRTPLAAGDLDHAPTARPDGEHGGAEADDGPMRAHDGAERPHVARVAPASWNVGGSTTGGLDTLPGYVT